MPLTPKASRQGSLKIRARASLPTNAISNGEAEGSLTDKGFEAYRNLMKQKQDALEANKKEQLSHQETYGALEWLGLPPPNKEPNRPYDDPYWAVNLMLIKLRNEREILQDDFDAKLESAALDAFHQQQHASLQDVIRSQNVKDLEIHSFLVYNVWKPFQAALASAAVTTILVLSGSSYTARRRVESQNAIQPAPYTLTQAASWPQRPRWHRVIEIFYPWSTIALLLLSIVSDDVNEYVTSLRVLELLAPPILGVAFEQYRRRSRKPSYTRLHAVLDTIVPILGIYMLLRLSWHLLVSIHPADLLSAIIILVSVIFACAQFASVNLAKRLCI